MGFFDLWQGQLRGKATYFAAFLGLRCLLRLLPALKATYFGELLGLRCLLSLLPALKATDFATFLGLRCLGGLGLRASPCGTTRHAFFAPSELIIVTVVTYSRKNARCSVQAQPRTFSHECVSRCLHVSPTNCSVLRTFAI